MSLRSLLNDTSIDLPTTTLGAEELHRVLGHHDRAALVRLLEDYDQGMVGVTALAGQLVETTGRDVRPSLEHAHLPLLEEAGVVVWHRDQGIVETTGETAALVGVLDVVDAVTSTDS